MKIGVKAKNVVIILLLAVAMLYRINSVRVQWYFRYFFIIPIIALGLLQYFWNRGNQKAKVARFVFIYTMVPHLFAFVYTIVLLIFGLSEPAYFSRTISNTIQMILTGMFVVSITMLYGNESTFIVFKSMIVSYAITMIMALRGIGISGVLSYIKSPGTSVYNIWFEMHDLCLSISLIILYLIFGEIGNPNKWKYITIAFIILVLGYKRIGIFALFIALIFGICVQKKASTLQSSKLWVTALIILGVGIVYTYICTTDIYGQLAIKYGIDTASRVRIYANFRKYYDLSFTFPGKGVGYVTKQLTLLQQAGTFGVGGITALHNDLLLQYVELGLWGSVIWFVYFIFRFPKKLKEVYGYSIERIYYILLVCAFITYCSDNTMHYFIFQSVLYLILTCEILNKSTDQRQTAREGYEN